MDEVLEKPHASARKSTESKLREAMAHEGHKVIAEAVGFDSSNVSRLLSGDQTTSFQRLCKIIDAAGLKLVPADARTIDPEDHKTLAKYAIKRIEYEAGP